MELPWRLFAGIILLFLLVGIVPFFIGDLHDAAEFANAFGFVNAMFAALAFGGVIWAIRLQTKELELQRLELEETRDELRRSADAQTLSQQMHFVSALLAARNNVAQGYAVAADREQGPLRPSHAAHREHLARLEWLLHQVDCHKGNPFPPPSVVELVTHQLAILLTRTYPTIQSALANGATNHARSLLLDLNHALRDLRRLLACEPQSDLSCVLDQAIERGEEATLASDFDEVAQLCRDVFNPLSRYAAGDANAATAVLC